MFRVDFLAKSHSGQHNNLYFFMILPFLRMCYMSRRVVFFEVDSIPCIRPRAIFHQIGSIGSCVFSWLCWIPLIGWTGGEFLPVIGRTGGKFFPVDRPDGLHLEYLTSKVWQNSIPGFPSFTSFIVIPTFAAIFPFCWIITCCVLYPLRRIILCLRIRLLLFISLMYF